ncbi:MAG TPA: NAD(P)/FAD-dependent oxidoreductase [Jatrophihabitantaceae bacterium]|nr:NAD(P)/FAD-dependent oxidoreductase [Jatrophihabitantaceae bacterium]
MRKDDAWLERVVEDADLNVLRIVLYQLTLDPALRDIATEKVPMRGGAFYVPAVAESARQAMKDLAVRLLRDLPEEVPPPPFRAKVRELAEMLGEQQLTDTEFDFGYEELGLEEFPRDVTWRNGRPAAADGFKVAVIGAGISGIATGVLLNHLGLSYTIFERLDGVGGVWCMNTYPEARVDTNISLYQYTFVKNYPWDHHFATQPEVKNYLAHVAMSYEVAPHVRSATEVMSADWLEDDAEWLLTTKSSDGKEEQHRFNAIISATGLFNTPKLPEFPGMDTFKGEITHTSLWNKDVDIDGKRVCLVGSGSSGVQVATHLAGVAGHLTVVQRTPNWVGPVKDYRSEYSEAQKWLFDNVPYYWNWHSYQAFASTTVTQRAQEHDRAWQANGGLISEYNDKMRETYTDYIKTRLAGREDLIEKCIPNFAPMGRRIVADSGWFDTLRRPNVDLIAASIERFVEDGIVTADGQHVPCDVVVLATGFQPSRYFYPTKYTGREGITLDDAWSKDGARAYLGMCMPGFPNLFTLYGPNSAPRAGGSYSWSEIWARYGLLALVDTIESGARSIEVRQEAFDRYNKELDETLRGLIWETEGTGGYQLNEFGRPGFSCPLRVDEYHHRLVKPDLDDFTVQR